MRQTDIMFNVKRLSTNWTWTYVTLALGLLIGLHPAAADTGEINPVSAASVFSQQEILDVSRTSPEFTSISMVNPEIEVGEIIENFESYHIFSIDGEFVISDEGQPALPTITRLYRIPDTGGADLVISNIEYHLEEEINAIPYRVEGKPFRPDQRDPMIYQRNQWFPSEIATISEPMIMRDFRVVEVTLYPVQVNPVTGQARIYDRIDVDVVANGSPGVNELLNPRHPSGRWAPIYRDMIRNLDEHALDDADPTPGTYLIIQDAHSTADAAADSLELWKKRRGFEVVIDRRSTWNSSTINTAITNLYNSSDPPLEFVCLIGDPSATFGVPTDGTGFSGNYDHNYALTAGGDDLEDVAVGRLCGISSGEMATIIAKIMAYERTPYMDDTGWFTSSFLYAGIARDVESNLQLMHWADASFSNNTGIVNNTVDYHTGDNVSETTVRTQLEAGVGIFLWRGTWLYGMSATLANTINTGPRLPIVLTITCSAGDFVGALAVSESYLVAGDPGSLKGGVCAIGSATIDTHAPQNICVTGGLAYAISNQNIEHVGTCLAAAKMWLGRSFGTGSYAEEHFSRYNNLLGDPGLSIWTDIPTVMDVTHPASLNVGDGRVQITVVEDGTATPIADALVVLWKGSETYIKGFTDASGQIDFPVTVDSAGDMLLTVTKRNHKPYLADISCSTASLMVSYEGRTVDDDNVGGTSGNNNGEINPGETVDLAITIRNHGTSTTGTGISANLFSGNSNVVVISGGSTYPDLSPGAQAVGNSTYRIQIDPSMVDGESAELTLEVTASATTTYSLLDLACQAGDVEYVSQAFIGGSFTPGATRNMEVTLRNNGSETMNGTTATLASLSPFVSVTDNSGTFGTITIGGTASNSGDRFTLTSNPLTYPGHAVTMQLVTLTTEGNPDTTYFTVNVGTAATTDPSGPDAYGYYAYDNTDAAYLEAPTYSYTNISSGLGTDLNLNDPGDKTTTSPTYSSLRTLPFDFNFYGQNYTQVTICSNGWLAFGNQSWNDAFRNYPIPSMVAPEALIAPYFEDLKTNGASQGVWDYYDAANNRYIVQWKASGGNSSYSQANLDFQVVLYDEDFYPTNDGNGKVLCQYADVTMNLSGTGTNETSGCSIGIQDASGLVGLPYAYQIDYEPGAATVVDGRAILFTTNGPGQFVDLIRPVGGELWYVGHVEDILWQSIGFTGDVNIHLNRDYPGGAWETLFANADNDGIEPWTVTGSSTTNARIRIISISDPSVGDTSDADFEIADPWVTLLAPNGGEIVAPGDLLTIAWSQAGFGTGVVELNRDYPGGVWEELTTGASGSYDWTVTAPPTTDARIRVTSIILPGLSDISDAEFTIGSAPSVTHKPLADMEIGSGVFIADIVDDVAGFVTKLYYRSVGGGSFDSTTFAPTGNPDEFSVNVPFVADGQYEYYVQCIDAQQFIVRVPAAGTYRFDVGGLCDAWTQYDDGTAETYNWVDGADFQWAVYFDPGSYPFSLCAGRYAINPTNPTSLHGPARFSVILADGPSGEPGTVVYMDTTGSVNQIGGLPAGAAWTDVVINGGTPLEINEPFYISVGNIEPRDCSVAFALDTTSSSGNSYLFDPCDGIWMNEDAVHLNTRTGNRMIRISGFGFQPPEIVIRRSGDDMILSWDDMGAPFYRVHSSVNAEGPFDTFLGSTSGLSYTHTGVLLIDDIRFYQVESSTTP